MFFFGDFAFLFFGIFIFWHFFEKYSVREKKNHYWSKKKDIFQNKLHVAYTAIFVILTVWEKKNPF